MAVTEEKGDTEEEVSRVRLIVEQKGTDVERSGRAKKKAEERVEEAKQRRKEAVSKGQKRKEMGSKKAVAAIFSKAARGAGGAASNNA